MATDAELADSGKRPGAETSRVLKSIRNDGEQPDEVRGLTMFEREERAADFEASDVGPAKRRTRPGRARWWILLALGILAQLVPVPFARGREAVRLAPWRRAGSSGCSPAQPHSSTP
jgi:hypothetical protein